MSVTFGLEVEDGFYTNGLRNRSHTIASLSQCVLSPTRYYMLLNPYYILISHAYLQTVLYVFSFDTGKVNYFNNESFFNR